jgi:hypothetical protein
LPKKPPLKKKVRLKPSINRTLIGFLKKSVLKKKLLKNPLNLNYAKSKKLKILNQKLESLKILNVLKLKKKQKVFSILKKTKITPELKKYLKLDSSAKNLSSIKKIKQYLQVPNFQPKDQNIIFLKNLSLNKQF